MILSGRVDSTEKLGGVGRELIIDKSTRAMSMIDYPHHEIHSGDHYFLGYVVPSLGAMTTPDDMIQIHFTTPNTTKWLHMLFQFDVGGATLYTITEAPTGGLANPTGIITAINNNRNSTKTTGVSSFSYDGTAATGGTVLLTGYVGTGTGPFSASGSSRSDTELVLKQNTIYAVSLYSTATNYAGIYLEWYEHTDLT